MRKLTVLVACLLTAAALTAGCSLFGGRGESKEEEIERLIDQTASFTVFLRAEATAQQRADVEARLRAIPGVTEVSYESKQEAYRRFRDMLASRSPESSLFDDIGQSGLDVETDRIMLCGSPAMLEELHAMFSARDFVEGSHSRPGHFVIEKAFVER